MKANYYIQSLLGDTVKCLDADRPYVERAFNQKLDFEEYVFLSEKVKTLGVTKEFKKVIDHFKTPEGETPAGFRVEYDLCANGHLEINLVRDISYGKNGIVRPTPFLYSADTANPYEVEPMKDLIANLTCNPGIIYDLFINNPKANIGGKFKNRDEVMSEIGRILGPGCDISVEFNDPFADFNKLIDEAEHFRELLSEYNVVIKVPHTSCVNRENAHLLLEGDKKMPISHLAGSVEDYFYSHELAYRLHERGFRVNYTLMFEPWQTGLALQAKPYFINSFINKRFEASVYIQGMLAAYDATKDLNFLKTLRAYFIDKQDYLPVTAADCDLAEVEKLARETLTYRKFECKEGFDGLDGVRHNLRMLAASENDTRLIICSLGGTRQYAELDKLFMEPEFKDILHKVVITTEPGYFGKHTSSPHIITYQRRFLNAVNNTADKS